MVEVTDSSSVSTTEKASQKCEVFFVFATSPLAKAKKARGQDARAGDKKGSGVTRAIFVDGALVPE